MIRHRVTRRQFSAGSRRLRPQGCGRHRARAARTIPAVRSASSCLSAPRASPISRRGSPRRSSATSSGSVSWWKISPGRAASRRRAVLSQAPDGHARPRHQRHLDQRRHLQGAAVRSGEGVRHHLDHRRVRPGVRHQRRFRVQDDAGLHEGGARAAGQAQCRHHQCRRHAEPRRRAPEIVRRGQFPDHPVPRHARRDRGPAAQRRAAHGRLLCADEADAGGQEDARGRHHRAAALAVLHRRAHRRGGRRRRIRGDVVERRCSRRPARRRRSSVC